MSLADFLNDLTGGDDALAEAAVHNLSGLPEEEQLAAMGALRARLASPEVDRRWWAVRSLAELPLSHTQSLLAQALKDPDPSVRQCAALGLRLQIKRTPGWNPAPESFDTLLPVLLEGLKDPDPLAARLAADTLAAIGEPVVPQLLELLDGSNRAVRLLGRRPGMADTLIGVTGDCLPASSVLNPLFLARMIVCCLPTPIPHSFAGY